MARFQREAQLLASLNHPKIAAIYGLEESGPTRALIMELVEGPTLAERIGRAAQSARSKASSGSPAQASAAASSGPNSGGQSASGASTRKVAIPLEESLPIAQQLAEALEYAMNTASSTAICHWRIPWLILDGAHPRPHRQLRTRPTDNGDFDASCERNHALPSAFGSTCF